jgi:micrococcal nuclease
MRLRHLFLIAFAIVATSLMLFPASAAVRLSSCKAVDGDTLRCGPELYRLSGIDAPEMPGHCRAGRACVAGDPFAARKALAAQIAGKTVYARRLFRDRYGRWIVVATAGNRNLSCTQLRGRFALFRPNWDRGGHIRRLCGK